MLMMDRSMAREPQQKNVVIIFDYVMHTFSGRKMNSKMNK